LGSQQFAAVLRFIRRFADAADCIIRTEVKWIAVLLLISAQCMAQPAKVRAKADEPLVDLAKVEPSIVIELRYATPRNIAKKPIYPEGMACLIRAGVAERLKQAQYFLRQRGYGLKIWDAYRPVHAQRILWDLVKNPAFVANPEKGALHTWGVAVDATLVDATGRDVPMPTDFDTFTSAAAMRYAGQDPVIGANLRLLQTAMGTAGFYGMNGEWWHFISKDWREYRAVNAVPAEPAGSPSLSP
jgi:zinc D-Ala-D-Ala dipeptidase